MLAQKHLGLSRQMLGSQQSVGSICWSGKRAGACVSSCVCSKLSRKGCTKQLRCLQNWEKTEKPHDTLSIWHSKRRSNKRSSQAEGSLDQHTTCFPKDFSSIQEGFPSSGLNKLQTPKSNTESVLYQIY